MLARTSASWSGIGTTTCSRSRPSRWARRRLAVLVVDSWLAPLVLLPLLLLHGAALVPRLDVAATLEPESGPLNDEAWHN